MITDGPYFTRTLDALELRDAQRDDTVRNARNIVSAVMTSYGVPPARDVTVAPAPNRPPTGLVYGRIQSGKTRAMIASTALAFDNGFRVSVVMTSNINDLVSQTHIDFSSGLPGIVTFTKDNDLDREVPTTRLHLERGDGRLLLICSKGSQSLSNIAAFLREIAADRFPAIIFDDEGDQASLDTNMRRRSRGIAVAPSAINNIIQSTLRPALPRHVYVSVTGTPQAVLLQSADSNNRPSFNVMLPPGSTYVGGDQFFDTDEPENNAALISLVDRNDQQLLLNLARPMPAGLRSSILFFLVSAASAIINRGLPERGYSYLCHPSLKNDEQANAEQRINVFLTNVYGVTLGATDPTDIMGGLRTAYTELTATLGTNTPQFDDVVRTIREYLPGRRILVVNARTKRTGIDYGRCLNFLIGGNTLGRGIAIRDLLVTYYVRETKISQIDTMHQHARMYGYRTDTLPYTRLFIPRHLYYRFRDIHRSDMDLRQFVEDNIARLPTTFPVQVAFSLRATRQGVLEVGKIDTLQPGQHIYPNVIVVPQNPRAYQRVLGQLRVLFNVANGTPDQIEAAAAAGVVINPGTAAALVAPIRTNSRNTWRDGTIADVMKKVAGEFGDQIRVRFRTADRTVGQDGFISTGTLSGDELRQARNAAIPTLWIMSATTTAASAVGGGQLFMYPTFVIPNGFPNLFIFNRGS
ncbi:MULTISPECIES: Z1 domain-containing protein [unclassified Bradyrhizobium]|uniref:Z1 domain-containing protein n=1 Tax=unclassified Bradyrhizobium TaxID=2631580 RepID=UPI002916F218|nr:MULTISPECIES: Z1 domain-containing protein [unclassified Bradyrhizobium]